MIVYALDSAGNYTRVNINSARMVNVANASGYFELTMDEREAELLRFSRLGRHVYVMRDSYGRVMRGYVDTVRLVREATSSIVAVTGTNALGLLERRVIAQPYTISETPADNAILGLVRYALKDEHPDIVVAANASNAAVISLDCSWRRSVFDAINDILRGNSDLYLVARDNDEVSNIAIVRAAQRDYLDAILAIESGSASRIEYTLRHDEERNVVYGVGRRTDDESYITVGPFDAGRITTVTRREELHDNPSAEDAQVLESETRAKLASPAQLVSVETRAILRVGDIVAVSTAVGNITCIVTACEYAWPDDVSRYTLEVLSE